MQLQRPATVNVDHVLEARLASFALLTVGGGVASVKHARKLQVPGADKVGVSSPALKNPALPSRLAERFGGQGVVLAIKPSTILGPKPQGEAR